MKQYLKIVSLLLLLTHLLPLVKFSFLPGESLGVPNKKICLRQQSQEKEVASQTNSFYQELVFPNTSQRAEKPGSKTEAKICSVDLFCDIDTPETALAIHLFRYQEPGFTPPSYILLPPTLEPDPPKFY